MARELVGHIQHQCGEESEVRKNGNSKLYIRCPKCGPINMHTQAAQDWILESMTPLSSPPLPVPAPPEPEPEPAPIDLPPPIPVPQPKPVRRGVLDFL